MVFTTGRYFEVAIENWPVWDLNPRPLIYLSNNKKLQISHYTVFQVQR